MSTVAYIYAISIIAAPLGFLGGFMLGYKWMARHSRAGR